MYLCWGRRSADKDRSSEVDYFDDSPFVFDNLGVKNYLLGTGKAGGPLVTSANATVRSDLRIFTSDNNATIKAIASTQSTFETACLKVFAKMVNTVPSGVTLSAPIGPRKFITMYSYVELSSTGVLSYIGQIGGYSKTAAPSTVSYTYKYMGGSTTTGTTQVGGRFSSNKLLGTVLTVTSASNTDYKFQQRGATISLLWKHNILDLQRHHHVCCNDIFHWHSIQRANQH